MFSTPSIGPFLGGNSQAEAGACGHIHTRKNLYEADITVEPVDGAWKIIALQILDEKRIDPYAPQPG